MQQINLKPFKDFLKSQTFGGVLLICCVVLSLLVANSPLKDNFETLLSTQLGFTYHQINLKYSLLNWINDGLMAIFFLMVGLEIKRELVEGELSTLKQASLPVVAALGGMILPALIYHLLDNNSPTSNGWGIPMATDIAFAIAILSLLGNKIPNSIKIFLTALAIVDDLGAILVIALFYSTEMHLTYLIYAGIILLMLAAFNYFGVKQLYFYIIPGLFIWYFIHHSGIHATIAGVLVALTVPTNDTADTSPLEHLEHLLSKPVTYLIMPVFALANTNITFEAAMLNNIFAGVSLGIFFGLLIGKPLGIFSLSWIAIKLKLSSLPDGSKYMHLLGAGILGGIGFTMSIFIALLSLSDTIHQTQAKFTILITSVCAGLLGFLVLNTIAKKKLS